MASIFLPDECPLVGHMINSYRKHHMRNRQSRVRQELKVEVSSDQPSGLVMQE